MRISDWSSEVCSSDLAAVRRNGLLVLESRFDAERTLQLVEEHRITHMFVVPTMFVRLLALPEAVRRKYDLSSLENVLNAGAPCAPDVKVRMIDWGGPGIFEYYGSTETGPPTFRSDRGWVGKGGVRTCKARVERITKKKK